MIEQLINNGANVNVEVFKDKKITMLLFLKIIFNQARQLNPKNFTPLHFAAEFNLKEMIELLISKGAKINTKDISYKNLNL